MAKNKVKTCLTLFGTIKSEQSVWWEFVAEAKNIINRFGYVPNYIGVQSQSFNSGKILLLNRSEKRFKKALDNGEFVKSLEIISLPDEFKQAAFDYYISLLMYRSYEPQHITISTNNIRISDVLSVEEIISVFEKFIDISHGELYELASSEDPLIYAMKGKPASCFKGLNILKSF